MIVRDMVVNTEKNSVVMNSFFLWSQIIILFLTAIPVISQLISSVYHVPVWTLPKIYELKIYALAILICYFLPLMSQYAPSLLQKNHATYQLYSLFLYPCSILIYASSLPDFIRYLTIFILTLIGMTVLLLEMYELISINSSFASRYYNQLLIASAAFSVFLIVCNSEGNTFNIFSLLAAGMFIFMFACVRYINTRFKYFVILVPVFLYIVIYGSMLGAIEVTHYSFFLGPIIEVLYGHFHPLDLDIQYGGGLTAFLAAYFKAKGLVSFAGLQELLKFLAFVQYFLIFIIAAVLYRSQKIAFLVLLSILSFNFFAPNINFYFCAPSSGFLRFGLMYLIIGCYLCEKKIVSTHLVILITSILTSIAILWSFESAVYTLPAILFAEYMNKSLKKFLPVFIITFSIITIAYLSPFILQGKWPPLWRYYEYALVYANGFGQIPLNRGPSFWWLFPLLYGFVLIKIVTREISNKSITALTIYGIAIFTYFAGRAHPISLFVVSIPFILLGNYIILNLKSASQLVKQILLSFSLIIFPLAFYVIDAKQVIVQGVWRVNLPLIKNFLLTGSSQPFLISDSGAPWLVDVSRKMAETGCQTYAPLVKYIENNSIAIISADDRNLIGFYACTKSHNALGLNPYYETALNQYAVNRQIKQSDLLLNHYVLVESKLLNSKSEFWDGQIASRFLSELHATKIGELHLDNKQVYLLFQPLGFHKRTHSPVSGQITSPHDT